MALSSISPQLPRVEQQNMELHVRSSIVDCSSVSKVVAVVASVFVTIAAFVLGGPITGMIVALLCGATLITLFNGNISSPNMIWFSGNPPGRGFDPHHPHGHGHVPAGRGHGNPAVPGHVQVGGGHFYPQPAPVGAPPHVGVGRGHFHPAPAPGAAPNVGVGRGHNHGGPTDAPPPSGPAGHVPVGGGRRG